MDTLPEFLGLCEQASGTSLAPGAESLYSSPTIARVIRQLSLLADVAMRSSLVQAYTDLPHDLEILLPLPLTSSLLAFVSALREALEGATRAVFQCWRESRRSLSSRLPLLMRMNNCVDTAGLVSVYTALKTRLQWVPTRPASLQSNSTVVLLDLLHELVQTHPNDCYVALIVDRTRRSYMGAFLRTLTENPYSFEEEFILSLSSRRGFFIPIRAEQVPKFLTNLLPVYQAVASLLHFCSGIYNGFASRSPNSASAQTDSRDDSIIVSDSDLFACAYMERSEQRALLCDVKDAVDAFVESFLDTPAGQPSDSSTYLSFADPWCTQAISTVQDFLRNIQTCAMQPIADIFLSLLAAFSRLVIHGTDAETFDDSARNMAAGCTAGFPVYAAPHSSDSLGAEHASESVDLSSMSVFESQTHFQIPTEATASYLELASRADPSSPYILDFSVEVAELRSRPFGEGPRGSSIHSLNDTIARMVSHMLPSSEADIDFGCYSFFVDSQTVKNVAALTFTSRLTRMARAFLEYAAISIRVIEGPTSIMDVCIDSRRYYRRRSIAPEADSTPLRDGLYTAFCRRKRQAAQVTALSPILRELNRLRFNLGAFVTRYDSYLHSAAFYGLSALQSSSSQEALATRIQLLSSSRIYIVGGPAEKNDAPASDEFTAFLARTFTSARVNRTVGRLLHNICILGIKVALLCGTVANLITSYSENERHISAALFEVRAYDLEYRKLQESVRGVLEECSRTQVGGSPAMSLLHWLF